MRQLSQGFLVVALLSMLPGRALAVAPALSYAGRLSDDGGASINGSRDMLVRIFDAESLGNLLFEQSFAAVPLDDGAFVLRLDTNAVTSSGTDRLGAASLFGDGGSRWLEITIAGVTLLPRQELTAVPASLNQADDSLFVPDWSSLRDVPAPVNEVAGLDATCGVGQVLIRQGGHWTCAADTSGTSLAWSAIVGRPALINALAPNVCSNGAMLKLTGTSWACGNDQPAMVPTVGLSSVSAAPQELTQLDALTCAPGQVVHNVAGVWSCADDQMSVPLAQIAVGSGVTSAGGSPANGTVTLAIDFGTVLRANPAGTASVATTAATAGAQVTSSAVLTANNTSVASAAGVVKAGVVGSATGNGRSKYGVVGWADSSGTNYGVYGLAGSSVGAGQSNFGVVGHVTAGTTAVGVAGTALESSGTTALYGVYGQAASGYAGYFTGDVAIAGDLLIGGTITGTVATRYVPILAFAAVEQSVTGSEETLLRFWSTIEYGGAGVVPVYAAAPVHLPQGAIVTSLSCVLFDNSNTAGGTLRVDLVRQANISEGATSAMATVETLQADMSSTAFQPSTTTIVNPVIDLSNFKYSLLITFGRDQPTQQILQFQKCVVGYR